MEEDTGEMVGSIPPGFTVKLRTARQQGSYTTMLMSTGLTFGSISALYGLMHSIISQAQYTILVSVVIGSAVVPTLIAQTWFLPRHTVVVTSEVSREREARAEEDAVLEGGKGS